MRGYDQNSASTIAAEVVGARARSIGWQPPDDDEDTPKAVEVRLAKFNIGCLDATTGEWAYISGGSRLFHPTRP